MARQNPSVAIPNSLEAKGQLISKYLFGTFNSSKKSNEKFLPWPSRFVFWKNLRYQSVLLKLTDL